MLRKKIKAGLFVAGIIVFVIAIFIGAAWITEYSPKGQEFIHLDPKAGALASDTLKIVTWNTGYAGLGDDMDFFMDGGRRVRGSLKRTQENMRNIADYLASTDADIILLQEVDRDSHRSYGTDQFEYYRERLPGYNAFFAYNYRSFFVPSPLYNPIGKVNAGIAIFSKAEPLKVTRYSYPGSFPFPVRLFNLKRCMLSAEYITKGGMLIMVTNTHNSAYDDGAMRQKETEFMSGTLVQWHSGGKLSVAGGDWNQNPPGYTPSVAERENRYFASRQVDAELFPRMWEFAYDNLKPSVRYLYEKYNPGVTTTSVIDMFLSSPGVRITDVKTADLGFHNSDHNPVEAVVEIR